MTDIGIEDRPFTDQENVESWARQLKDLEKLNRDRLTLEDKIVVAENQFGHIKRTVCELVDDLHDRRVFKTSLGLVLIERLRKNKKYPASKPAPPPEYKVRIELLEVEE